MLAAWVISGRIAWVIIGITFLEAMFLILHRRITGGGVALRVFLPSLLAGDFLLLAWATNAAHALWTYTTLALLGALLCHLTQIVGWVSAAQPIAKQQDNDG